MMVSESKVDFDCEGGGGGGVGVRTARVTEEEALRGGRTAATRRAGAAAPRASEEVDARPLCRFISWIRRGFV